MTTTETTQTNPDEYNGWTNRETWAAALHLSNDESLYNICRRMVAGSSNNMIAGEDLERFVTDAVECVLYPNPNEPGEEWTRLMISDVGSFWRVDWKEVAQSFRDE
jgi:hypothetical protein